MFDLTSSKLLILGIIALLVVGPKDLPVLLRAVGKYVGMLRRQANEFRLYFDEAMRETELANLKAEVDAMKRDVQETVSSAGRALEADVAAVKSDVDSVSQGIDQSIKGDGLPQSGAALSSASGSHGSFGLYRNGVRVELDVDEPAAEASALTSPATALPVAGPPATGTTSPATADVAAKVGA